MVYKSVKQGNTVTDHMKLYLMRCVVYHSVFHTVLILHLCVHLCHVFCRNKSHSKGTYSSWP